MFKEKTIPGSPVAIEENPLSVSVKPRFESIDLLRGFVMVLMALDHVRDYFTNVRFDPLDLEQTNGALFLTRWITHYCAPVFVFLAGTGSFLAMGRGKSKNEVAGFLLSRGLWLIFLEFSLVRSGWSFGITENIFVAQVIWVIGLSMVLLSFLIYLPLKILTAFSILMIISHNLFDGITPQDFGSFSWLWIILHEFAPVHLGGGNLLFIGYPLIPWVGVMAAGYCFGTLYKMDSEKRKRILLKLSTVMIAGFIFLRLLDFYGDPNKWTMQENFLFTLFDFIDTTKYPPSFLFLLMTLGPAFFILYLLEKKKENNKGLSFFLVFGRVPLFYYLLHIPLIHLMAVLISNAAGVENDFMFGSYPFFWQSTEWGYSLPVVYLVWIATVLILYPICFWYYNIKRKKKSKLLSYL